MEPYVHRSSSEVPSPWRSEGVPTEDQAISHGSEPTEGFCPGLEGTRGWRRWPCVTAPCGEALCEQTARRVAYSTLRAANMPIL